MGWEESQFGLEVQDLLGGLALLFNVVHPPPHQLQKSHKKSAALPT